MQLNYEIATINVNNFCWIRQRSTAPDLRTKPPDLPRRTRWRGLNSKTNGIPMDPFVYWKRSWITWNLKSTGKSEQNLNMKNAQLEPLTVNFWHPTCGFSSACAAGIWSTGRFWPRSPRAISGVFMNPNVLFFHTKFLRPNGKVHVNLHRKHKAYTKLCVKKQMSVGHENTKLCVKICFNPWQKDWVPSGHSPPWRPEIVACRKYNYPPEKCWTTCDCLWLLRFLSKTVLTVRSTNAHKIYSFTWKKQKWRWSGIRQLGWLLKVNLLQGKEIEKILDLWTALQSHLKPQVAAPL